MGMGFEQSMVVNSSDFKSAASSSEGPLVSGEFKKIDLAENKREAEKLLKIRNKPATSMSKHSA